MRKDIEEIVESSELKCALKTCTGIGVLMLRKIMKKGILAVYKILRFMPLQKRTICFMSNLGRSYGGNPKSIYEEMVREGLDQEFRCIFILEDTNTPLPGRVWKVRLSRFRYYYFLAVAGIWVSDTRFPNYIKKRKGVTYLQTWHGTPLKKLALDMTSLSMAGEETLEQYHEEFRKNTATWDYLISQNPFSSETFQRAFDFHGEILEYGYPRNDVLFKKNNSYDIDQIKKKLNLPRDKKIILYAPTWRDNEYHDKANYKFSAPLDYDYIYEQLNKDYVILLKYHYMVREKLQVEQYRGFYRVVEQEVDISELYLVSDMLITDYSSVMFDYSLLYRPILFYVYDLKEYEEELRGFYFDFVEEAPGPLFTSSRELVSMVKNYYPEDYTDKYKAFCEKYHTFENGNAAKRAVRLLASKVMK